MHWTDTVIFTSDWIRGLARYPRLMLGRHIEPSPADPSSTRRVLVIAAHPDDETIGLGATLVRQRKDGATIDVVFTTNGRGWSWTAPNRVLRRIVDRRRGEAEQALGMARIFPDHIHCLGFPDRGLHRFLRPLGQEIHNIITWLKPDVIYTHGFEGGHIDHDVTSLVVQQQAQALGILVYEWAEYNRENQIGTVDITFPKLSHQVSPPLPQCLSREETWTKALMLRCYVSEEPAQQAVGQGETIRVACPDSLPLLLTTYYDPSINPVGYRYHSLLARLLSDGAS